MSSFAYAQNSYSINGLVKDESSGEPITGATIKVKENPTITIETNEYGFYSMSLPENDYTMIISHSKHQTLSKSIHLDGTLKMDWSLKKENEIELVELKGKKSPVVAKSKSGGEVLDVVATSKLPVLLGERDILKTIQFLPGVASQEGSSGISVRGGNTDQNLILLDEAPVFNNSHFFEFFSTFNSDALRNVTLYKSNIPSQYGGRLSSVLDIKGKEGNNQKFGATGGIGLISSRLSVEAPINYNVGIDSKEESIEIKPKIDNYIFKQDFSHYVNQKHSLKYGLQTSYYNFTTPTVSGTQESPIVSQKRSMWENALYVNDDYQVTDKLLFNYGIRATLFSAGNGEAAYGEAAEKNNHIVLEPRLMLNYELNKNNIVTASYFRTSQGLQALSANDGSLVNDVWINLKKRFQTR